MKRTVVAALAWTIPLAPTAALAHTGHGDTAGLMHGIAHPLGGIDHILAMVAVGMLAGKNGGRSLWLLPFTFVTVMAGAAILGVAGIQSPVLEIGIAMSLVAFGLAVAYPSRMSSALSVGLIALFAAFHGYVHGAEMPAGVSGLAYAIGFLIGTVLLITLGTGLAVLVRFNGGQLGYRAIRAGGGAIGLYGLAILSAAV